MTYTTVDRMQKGGEMLLSLIAGAAGGALMTIVAFSSPQAARLFGISPTLLAQPGSTAPDGAPSVSSTDAFEQSVIAAVEKASPAVVSIVVTKDVPIVEQFFEDAPSPFGDFFGDDLLTPFRFRVPQYRQRGTEKQEIGGGSGFLVSADGMIVTNRHVVANDDVEYTVFLNDGGKHTAQVVARDPVNDLAVIRIPASGLPFLHLASSDELKVGQSVIAIGNALAEFRNTVSVGVISGLSRSIIAGGGATRPEQLEEVIQTDAGINPGNSGGPLLNLHGEVVGVNVAVALGSENIGFALPVNLVRGVVESVQQTGTIVRPYLGVRYTVITPPLKQANNLPVDHGMLVVRGESAQELAVLPGSPADKAGLAEGDIILEADGKTLDENTSLAAIIRPKQVGDAISLKIFSKGRERIVSVTLEALPQ